MASILKFRETKKIKNIWILFPATVLAVSVDFDAGQRRHKMQKVYIKCISGVMCSSSSIGEYVVYVDHWLL